jgi:hypothetical protein
MQCETLSLTYRILTPVAVLGRGPQVGWEGGKLVQVAYGARGMTENPGPLVRGAPPAQRGVQQGWGNAGEGDDGRHRGQPEEECQR